MCQDVDPLAFEEEKEITLSQGDWAYFELPEFAFENDAIYTVRLWPPSDSGCAVEPFPVHVYFGPSDGSLPGSGASEPPQGAHPISEGIETSYVLESALSGWLMGVQSSHPSSCRFFLQGELEVDTPLVGTFPTEVMLRQGEWRYLHPAPSSLVLAPPAQGDGGQMSEVLTLSMKLQGGSECEGQAQFMALAGAFAMYPTLRDSEEIGVEQHFDGLLDSSQTALVLGPEFVESVLNEEASGEFGEGLSAEDIHFGVYWKAPNSGGEEGEGSSGPMPPLADADCPAQLSLSSSVLLAAESTSSVRHKDQVLAPLEFSFFSVPTKHPGEQVRFRLDASSEQSGEETGLLPLQVYGRMELLPSSLEFDVYSQCMLAGAECDTLLSRASQGMRSEEHAYFMVLNPSSSQVVSFSVDLTVLGSSGSSSDEGYSTGELVGAIIGTFVGTLLLLLLSLFIYRRIQRRSIDRIGSGTTSSASGSGGVDYSRLVVDDE